MSPPTVRWQNEPLVDPSSRDLPAYLCVPGCPPGSLEGSWARSKEHLPCLNCNLLTPSCGAKSAGCLGQVPEPQCQDSGKWTVDTVSALEQLRILTRCHTL